MTTTTNVTTDRKGHDAVKVAKTIASCFNMGELRTAHNMIFNYEKKYGTEKILHEIYEKRRILILLRNGRRRIQKMKNFN